MSNENYNVLVIGETHPMDHLGRLCGGMGNNLIHAVKAVAKTSLIDALYTKASLSFPVNETGTTSFQRLPSRQRHA
jgi:hypothetical protein